jgi:chromate transport protein ChrA
MKFPQEILEENNNSHKLQITCFKLVLFFGKVGATAFGGGVPAHLCSNFLKNAWLNEQECLELLNLCQLLPGATSVNIATLIGWRFQGLLGALIAPLALLLPGAIALLLTSNILITLTQQPIIQGVLSATAAATVGLFLGVAIRLLLAVNRKYISFFISSIIFILVGIYQVPVPLIILPTLLLNFAWNRLQKGKLDEHSI